MSLDGSMQPLIRIPRGTKVIRFFHERETENIGGGSWGQKRHFRHSFVWDDRDRAGGPTDTQSQTGRQTTREGQSTKCTGRQDGTQGDTFLFKGPARSPLECVPLTLIRCQKISFPFGVVAGRCRERGREGEGEGEDTNETGDGRMDGWIGSVINQSAEGIYSSNLFCVYLT